MLCVLLISVLWGGGLAAVLPGMKILLAPEGLHGWAFNTMTQDRLDARVVQRFAPPNTKIQGQNITLVIDIVSVGKKGPAARAGLQPNTWIIGMAQGQEQHPILRGDVLARDIAGAQAGQTVTLTTFDLRENTVSAVNVRLAKARTTSRWLDTLARAIPEPQDEPGRMPMLLWLLGLVIGITFVRELLRFTQEYLVQVAVSRSLMDLRCENYNVVLHLPTTFFSQQGVTDSMSRFIHDSSELSHGQITLFGKTLVEPGKAVSSFVVAMLLSWKLTLLATVAGPPTYLLIRRFGEVMKRASRRALESWSSMLAVLEETLVGIRVVKAYTMEGGERKRFFRVNRRLLRQQKKMAKIDSATAPTVEALGIVAALAAVAIAGYWVLHGEMDRELFMAWMAALAAMFDPVRKLASVVTRFQRSEAAATRIFEQFDTPQEKRVRNAPMLPRHKESIEFRGVRFRYPGASSDALKDINLTIRAGTTVAIVGPNGCGKTTLVSLVPRLLDPTEGCVLIDGKDISMHSVRSVRRQIGLVTQETVLFHATVAENIAYGLRRPRMDNVMDAARKAFVDEFVRNLPEGYDTMVGEHGATLSGGERQRITIARAILRDPAILIFDEATSQIDSGSETRIHQAMEEFVKNRTTLLIAHRFATVLSAERIVVMDDGRIIDTGTHHELLERCQFYHHLYKTQYVATAG